VFFVAYVIHGMMGFGAASVANPLLAHLLPIRFLVPLTTVQDFVIALVLGRGFARNVVLPEYVRIVVPMLCGMALGLVLLIRLPERWAIATLGAVVLANGLWALFGRPSERPLHRFWSVPLGLAGGLLSGLFGFGGPLYVIYLSRRLPDVAQMRSTIGAILFTSASTRLALLAASGLLAQENLWLAIAWFLPFFLGGGLLGAHLHLRLPAHVVRAVLNAVLVLTGGSLVWRAL
jgi:uncharacterized membrane protein YfcA